MSLKRFHHTWRFVLLGLVFLTFSILMCLFIIHQWRVEHIVDPLNIFLFLVGSAGVIVSVLIVAFLVRQGRRGS
jgi:hypothetical protein